MSICFVDTIFLFFVFFFPAGCCIQKENSVMTLQQYKHGGFPPSSKLLNKLWTYENHKRHRKKVIDFCL